MVYLIKYELNKPGKDYSSLYNALRQYQYIRDDSLHSAWFVSTTWTAAQIYEHVRLHFDVNDRIFITMLHRGENHGWLNKDVWTWINARI
jgi:hypothetical protein